MNALLILPVLGTLVAVSVPLMRYADKQRQEGRSIVFLQSLRSAQDEQRARHGAYAGDLDPLGVACPADLKCEIAPLDGDYYAAVAPVSAHAASQQAYAMRSDGRIYVFFDGVAPKLSDMESNGLATPLERLTVFKIP